MKYTLLFLITFTSVVYAHQGQKENEKILYANIYADQLIEQFDQELESIAITKSMQSIMQSPTYFQIIAAREYIEKKSGKIYQYKEKPIILTKDISLYNEIIIDINEIAKNKIKPVEQEIANTPILFPSHTRSGNVTGNTFPKDVWSLTFDDGPHSSRTQEVLDNLYLHNMKASFFVLMRQINLYPDALESILTSDMELALHSYNHLNLNKQDETTMEYEVGTSKKELEEASDKEIKIFRLPYGAGLRNELLRKTIEKHNMIHIFWNVDTLDWKDKDPQSIYNRTVKQMDLTPNKSGIILFHDIHAQTVIASELVMKYLNENSKKVCTVGEVINFINGSEQSCL